MNVERGKAAVLEHQRLSGAINVSQLRGNYAGQFQICKSSGG